MINLSDLVGVLMQSGMSKSTTSRARNAIGGGQGGGGGLGDLLGSLGGPAVSATPSADCSAAAVAVGALDGLGGMLGAFSAMPRSRWAAIRIWPSAGSAPWPAPCSAAAANPSKGPSAAVPWRFWAPWPFPRSRAAARKRPVFPSGCANPRERRKPKSWKATPSCLEGHDQCRQGRRPDRRGGNAAHRGQAQRRRGRSGNAGLRSGRDEKTHRPGPAHFGGPGKPELGAQLYAASLMAIEVDTPGEEPTCGTWPTGWGFPPILPRASSRWSAYRSRSSRSRLHEYANVYGGKGR